VMLCPTLTPSKIKRFAIRQFRASARLLAPRFRAMAGRISPSAQLPRGYWAAAQCRRL
jgi:hypothetical protein